MLSENGNQSLRPPPYRGSVPRYHSKHENRCRSCCKCMCCCCTFFFFVAFSFCAIFFYLFVFFQPKVPSYTVQNLKISQFQVGDDFSLSAEFTVTVRAENPNSKISIIYGEKSSVSVKYMDSVLCSGKIPAFQQGSQNITVMEVVLRGKSEFGSGLQEALMDSRKKGRIPLEIFVKVPVSLELGSYQTAEVKVLVDCNLVVNSLSPREKIKILSSHYKVNVNDLIWIDKS